MLTLFACPKPFRGHHNLIQRNAIQSWMRLEPHPEIILLGNDSGTAMVAEEYSIRHIPDVECNEYGTPLIRSLFGLAQQTGQGSLFAYVNSDILLMSDFMQAIQQAPSHRFLMAGCRWNLDVDSLIAFESNWELHLRDRVTQAGQLEGPHAIDYFIFPRHTYTEIPPFAVGRPCWDNWMLYKALEMNIPLIEITGAVMAVHQNHDYSHHPQGKDGVFKGAEAQQSLNLIGGRDYAFFMLDLANWLLTPKGLRQPTWTRDRLERCVTMLPFVRPELKAWSALFKHLIDYRLHSDLSDEQMQIIQQKLGEAFFSKPDRWFWFSVNVNDETASVYLGSPAQWEAIAQLQTELQHTQQLLEQTQIQLQDGACRIQAIQSSKFWKLRTAWHRLKQNMRLARAIKK